MNETASLNGTSSPQNSAYYISSFFLSRDLCSAAHKKGFISLYNRQKFYKVQFKKFSLNVIILYSLFCPVHKYFVYWKLGRHLRQQIFFNRYSPPSLQMLIEFFISSKSTTKYFFRIFAYIYALLQY